MSTDIEMTFTGETPHPGQFIREELEARGWAQRDLAYVLGVPEQAVNLIVAGKRGVSAEMAKLLGQAFGTSAALFINLQKSYELSRAREPDPSIALRGRFQSVYPVREMINRGWLIDVTADLLEVQLTRFFEVSDRSQIPNMPAYAAKKIGKQDEIKIPPPQLAWLFRVRQIAREISVPRYSEKGLRDALPKLQRLLSAPEEVRHVPRILRECGVRYVIVESLPQAKIDGVCTWLDDASPVIGMTTLNDRIDNYWFVLRHEIEHVLRKHGRDVKIGTARVDADLEKATANMPDEESVANKAAVDFCVPAQAMEDFFNRKYPYISERDILGFAARLQIHPGLVAGQVRKRLDRWNIFTKHLAKIRQSLVVSGVVVDGWGTVAPVAA